MEHQYSSTNSTTIALRLPNEAYAILERRAKRSGQKVSEYVRWLVMYDALRKR